MDLSEFLETIDSDLEEASRFLRTGKLPDGWLEILSDTLGGTSIIEHFGNGKCLDIGSILQGENDPIKHKIMTIRGTEALPIDDGLDEEGLIEDFLRSDKEIKEKDDEISKEEDAMHIPIPDVQEIDDSRKIELLEKMIVIPEKYRQSFMIALKRLAKVDKETLDRKLNGDLVDFFERDGRIHKKWKEWILTFEGGILFLEKCCSPKYDENFKKEEIPDTNGSAPENPISIVIPSENIESFLIGFQGITGWHDRAIFPQKAGDENIRNFKKDGYVPLAWLEVLSGLEGGRALIDRYVRKEPVPGKTDVSATEIGAGENNAANKAPARHLATARKNAGTEEIVDKKNVGTILKNMLMISKLSKKALEELVGWPTNTFYAIKAGKRNLYVREIETFAEKKEIPVESLFQNDTGQEIKESGTIPAKPAPGNDPEVPEPGKKDLPNIPADISRALYLAIFEAGAAPQLALRVFLGSLTVQLPNHVLFFSSEKNLLTIMDRNSDKEAAEIKIGKDLPFLMR